MGAPPRAQEASRRQRQYLRREKAVALSQGYRLIKRYIHILIAVLVVLIGFNVSTEIALAPTVHAQYDAPVSIVAAPEASTTKAIPKEIPDAIACNCVSYLHTLIVDLPLQKDIIPNGPPSVGGVVVLNYHGTPHLAYITGFTADGVEVKEANYHHCEYDTRVIKWNDEALVGFWHA